MITRGGMVDIIFYRKIRENGLSDEVFSSLPIEYQKAIIMAGIDEVDNKEKLDNFRKKIALKRYIFEEDVKEKVYKLVKKNK